ncbi:hypothetical protein IAR50_000826 [Cryptococcus sp. DSM 104548]
MSLTQRSRTPNPQFVHFIISNGLSCSGPDVSRIPNDARKERIRKNVRVGLCGVESAEAVGEVSARGGSWFIRRIGFVMSVSDLFFLWLRWSGG